MKQKKIAMMVAAAMVLSLTGGAKADAAGDTAAREGQITFPLEEKEEINICVQARTLHTTPFDEMPFVKMMEEMTNVHVNWTEYPETSWGEKINLDFASGNLADAYMTCYGMDDSTFMNYAADGSVIAIDEILERQAPHLMAKLDQFPQVRAQATALDGHIYGLPRYENEGNDIPSFMYINKKWLDELNLEIPKTTSELTEVLRAFKEQDPNGNGQADEIPVAGIGDFSKQDYSFFNMFGMFGVATDMNGLIIEDGTVKCAATQEGWKDACKYFAELYQEGLLDNETFTQGETQVTAKGSGEDEKIGLLMGWNATNYVGSTYVSDYVAIPYPSAEGYSAKIYKNNVGLSYNNFWVTSECENPDLVIAWLDFMNSSDVMSVQASYGMIEDGENKYNLHYNEDGALEYWTASPEGMTFGEYRHKYSPATSAYVIHDIADMAQKNIFLGNPNNMAKAAECRTFDDYAIAEYMPVVKFTDDEAETLANIKNSILDQILQMSARWIAGESNIDEDWDSYISSLNGVGLDEYISIYQEAYDRYKEQQ